MISAPVAPNNEDPLGIESQAEKTNGTPVKHPDDDPLGLGSQSQTQEAPKSPREALIDQARQRFNVAMQTQTEAPIKLLAKKDMMAELKENALSGMNATDKTQDQLSNERLDIIKKYVGDENTPSYEQTLTRNMATDRPTLNRVIRQVTASNPNVGRMMQHDLFVLDSQGRTGNDDKVIQKASDIANGKINYDPSTGQLEKPLDLWGSFLYGSKKSNDEANNFDDFKNINSTDAINKLEKMRAEYDPYEPVEKPSGFGFATSMLGANAKPMAESAISGTIASLTSQPEITPIVNAAIFGNNAHKKSWWNSYYNTYNNLRNNGVLPQDAEPRAREIAEHDSNVDMITAMTAAAGMSALPIKEPMADFNPDLSGDLTGMSFHTPEFEPEYIQAVKKVAANTIGDKTLGLAKNIATEGGSLSVLNTALDHLKYSHNDDDDSKTFWGNMLFTGALAAMTKAPQFLSGIPKENMVPEMNPDTEDGAKLFIETPNEPRPAVGQETQPTLTDLLNSAATEIGKGNTQGIAKGPLEESVNDHDQLGLYLHDIADQANDPNSAQLTNKVFGEPLVNIAKQYSQMAKDQAMQPPPEGYVEGGTGIKNAISSATRTVYGLPPVAIPKIGNDVDILNNGKKLVDSGTINPNDIINRVLSKPEGGESMNSDEAAAMQYHMYKLSQAEEQARTEYNLSNNPDSKASANGKLQQLGDQIDAATKANMLAGTDWSKVGFTRQITVDPAFNPHRESAVINAAYGGKMPADVQAKFDQLTKERNDALAQIDKLKNTGDQDEQTQKMTTQDMVAAREKVIASQSKIQKLRQDALNSQQGQLQRAMNFAARWERRIVLSGLNVFTKLSSAATIGSAAQKPLEFAVSNAFSNMFKSVADKAPIEGFQNAQSLGKYYSEFFNGSKFLKDAQQIYKTGQSPLSQEFEQPSEHYPWFDAMTDTHQVIKDPVKRAEFERALSQYSSWAEQHNVDLGHPLAMEYVRQQAYQRALYEIFQENSGISNAVSKLQRTNSATDFLTKMLVPINKVPLNIARRMFISSPLGLAKGGFDLAQAYHNGIANLKPEEADQIIREFTKGTLGTAYWLAGAYMYKDIGGLYTKFDQAKKNQQGLKNEEWQIDGSKVPPEIAKPVGHAMPFQLAESGATMARIYNHFREENKGVLRSLFNAAAGTAGATIGDIPIIQEPVHAVQALVDPHALNQFEGEAQRRVVPQILRETGIFPKDITFPAEAPTPKANAIESGRQ